MTRLSKQEEAFELNRVVEEILEVLERTSEPATDIRLGGASGVSAAICFTARCNH